MSDFTFKEVGKNEYEAYQRAQEPKLEEPKKDVGKITTEDWEVL